MTEIARDVVIIGAGSAGLIAANELRMTGLSVAVLDACDRISETLDERAHLLAERLGEDVLLGRRVQVLRWRPTPSVIAEADGITVHARFAIIADQSTAGTPAIEIDPLLPTDPLSRPHDVDPNPNPNPDPGDARNTVPIHFAPSDDRARTAASTIIETIRS